MAIILAVAVGCAGCALESDETRPDGEARDGLASYFKDFEVSDRGPVGPEKFHVAQGGTVDAEMTTTWLPKAGYSCKVGAVILILKRLSAPGAVIGGKSYLVGHAKQTRTWSALAAGDYSFTLDAMNDNENCVLSGRIDFTVKP
jgi:hypothetical protein